MSNSKQQMWFSSVVTHLGSEDIITPQTFGLPNYVQQLGVVWQFLLLQDMVQQFWYWIIQQWRFLVFSLRCQLNVICIYHPLIYSSSQFRDTLCRITNNVPNVPTMCYWWLYWGYTTKKWKKTIYKTFLAIGFTQHIQKPTRNSGTLLDNSYTKYIRGVWFSDWLLLHRS